MVKRKLVIIAIQEVYSKKMSNQIRVIFGDIVSVRAITIKDLKAGMIEKDEIVLLSGHLIEPFVKSFIPKGAKHLIVKRGINFLKISKLLSLPEGSKILVVNDTRKNTDEVVEELRENVDIHHYIPYYPDKGFPDDIDYVVTPGEKAMIPGGIENSIDLGHRIVDISTVIQLYDLLGIKLVYPTICKRYMTSLLSLTDEAHMYEDIVLENNKINDLTEYTAKYTFDDIITYSEEMKRLVRVTKKFALSDEPVHIIGNVGTGKSMLAEAIHNFSHFKEGPYVSINCESRIARTLENELFGYEDNGRYTRGLFEVVRNGTLCIEEVGELPLDVQARLIQVLQENKVYCAERPTPVPVKLRIITTSTVDIKELVSKGVFKKELYYLLTKMTCVIPQLKDREGDLEVLISSYLKNNLKRDDIEFTDSAMEILHKYTWDGNVKELFNLLTLIACGEEKIITVENLPFFAKLWNKDQKRTYKNEKNDIDVKSMIEKIEQRGFLGESLEILKVFLEGKKKHSSYGRTTLRQLLLQRGMNLTDQQLRLRIEILNDLNLVTVRHGRAGTTISRGGERFLDLYYQKEI
ncbi:sigma 54-interacting transcriptional regulator [Wukongibacter baidiensis]|uniref:sigma 54-interacting transcriptional regulator n=1 Tax=Wukongibacter baidiensis TaxID=1723361 RepID=UPI003D7FB0A6